MATMYAFFNIVQKIKSVFLTSNKSKNLLTIQLNFDFF